MTFHLRPRTEDSFSAQIRELIDIREKNLQTTAPKPSVVILGAGVSGLFQAILALTQGNPVKVIEQGLQGRIGRSRGIVLTKKAVEQLKKHAVYQELDQNRQFGISTDEGRFPVSVSIDNLERAMKKVIFCLNPCEDEEVILYDHKLEQIVEKEEGVDLFLRTQAGIQNKLSRVNILIVAEGSKSSTAENLLRTRRVAVLSPLTIFGAAFEDQRIGGKSFNYIRSGWGAGTVIFTPGLCSTGFLPLKSKDSPSAAVNQPNRIEINPEPSEEMLKSWVEPFFKADEANHQSPPSMSQVQSAFRSTTCSDFAFPFCGKIGRKALFFLTGDALFQIDVATGRGASKALELGEKILPALQGGSPDRILEAYDDTASKKIEKSMKKTHCLRLMNEIQVDERSYSFGLFQLEHRVLVEKIQKIAGPRLAGFLFRSEWGEKGFRTLVRTLDAAKHSRCLRRVFGN